LWSSDGLGERKESIARPCCFLCTRGFRRELATVPSDEREESDSNPLRALKTEVSDFVRRNGTPGRLVTLAVFSSRKSWVVLDDCARFFFDARDASVVASVSSCKNAGLVLLSKSLSLARHLARKHQFVRRYQASLLMTAGCNKRSG
jgi:hypothetical protein